MRCSKLRRSLTNSSKFPKIGFPLIKGTGLYFFGGDIVVVILFCSRHSACSLDKKTLTLETLANGANSPPQVVVGFPLSRSLSAGTASLQYSAVSLHPEVEEGAGHQEEKHPCDKDPGERIRLMKVAP